MKIVLFNPQIPQNTGNIVRTCAVTGNELILVKPLGFSVSDRWLKRAGLDYWEGVQVSVLEEQEFLDLLENAKSPFYFFSSKATKVYSEITYGPNDMLIFGSETSGLPTSLFDKWPNQYVKLPMRPDARCLNLATSVGIAVYEAWRVQGFG